MNIETWKLLLSALGGALASLAIQGVWKLRQDAITAKHLCVAFREELLATSFYVSRSVNRPGRCMGGFSSQTFDSVFAEALRALPISLSRHLMNYHWRAKYLWEQQAQLPSLDLLDKSYDELKALREDLLLRLDTYQRRWTLELAIWSREVKAYTLRLR